MPRKAGWDTLQVREEIKEDLKEIWTADNKKPLNQKFSGYINNILMQVVEYQEILKRHGPLMEIISVSENMINIYDHLRKQPVTVYLDTKTMKLRCSNHINSDCVHVGFCFGIPETYKALTKIGFTPANPDPEGYYVHAGYDADLFVEDEPKKSPRKKRGLSRLS